MHWQIIESRIIMQYKCVVLIYLHHLLLFNWLILSTNIIKLYKFGILVYLHRFLLIYIYTHCCFLITFNFCSQWFWPWLLKKALKVMLNLHLLAFSLCPASTSTVCLPYYFLLLLSTCIFTFQLFTLPDVSCRISFSILSASSPYLSVFILKVTCNITFCLPFSDLTPLLFLKTILITTKKAQSSSYLVIKQQQSMTVTTY